MDVPEHMRQIVSDIGDYYVGNPTGGSLHIVLDDDNIEDGHIRFCLNDAMYSGDEPGARLAQQLLLMPMADREMLQHFYPFTPYRIVKRADTKQVQDR